MIAGAYPRRTSTKLRSNRPVRPVNEWVDAFELIVCQRERFDRAIGGGDVVERTVKRLTKRAGITKRISAHSLRHSFITAALDAGVSLGDVQEAASHADPRTTMRYDRARQSLDRHATDIVAAFVAGAARSA
jgi:integrase